VITGPEIHFLLSPVLREQFLSVELGSEDAPFDRWIKIVDQLLNEERSHSDPPKILN
jgi:hypothetical protein